MLSMCKDDNGKTVLNVINCETLSDVKVVEMKNLGLLEFDQQIFTQLTDVEELDLSGNNLDNIPDSIKLNKLKKLNCSRNKFSHVMFVQQFPSLEEVNFAENDITFPDFCIASVLCPTLKRINNQNIDFSALNLKMEDKLKPLINQVWSKSFAPYYSESLTKEEFESMGEKFRIMLKHANIKSSKLVTKFKDFKLLQLIDQFLEDVRTKPGQGRNLSKKYQRNSAEKNGHGNPNSTLKSSNIPVMVVVNKNDGTTETMEATMVVVTESIQVENTNVNEIKQDSTIFGDEEAVSVSSEIANTSTQDGQLEGSLNSENDGDKKVKYWLYDGKTVPKKKEVKLPAKRQRRGSLKRYIIGSVSNNSKPKDQTAVASLSTPQQINSPLDNNKSPMETVEPLKQIRAKKSKEPVKKRVRFIDDNSPEISLKQGESDKP